MPNLQYSLAATLSACVIASSTVLVSLGKIDPERYAVMLLTLVAYWMPPPQKDFNNKDKD